MSSEPLLGERNWIGALYDLLERVRDNTFIIICHYSVCVIYDLSKAGRST